MVWHERCARLGTAKETCLYRSYMPVSPIYGRPKTLVMSLHELHACLPVCGKPKTLVMSLQELHACLPVCGKPKTLVMSLHEPHACLPYVGNPKHSLCLYRSYTPVSSVFFFNHHSIKYYFIRVIISRRWVGLAAHIVQNANTQRVRVGKPKVKNRL